MKNRLLFFACALLIHISVKAQMKIGDNPTNINSASLLELETTNKGFVFPRVPLTDVASPLPLPSGLLAGTVVYNTNAAITNGNGIGLYIWGGSVWMSIATGSTAATAWNLTGNAGTNYAANFIGTIDKAGFRMRTNNIQRMLIDSIGDVGIGSEAFDPFNRERLLVDYGATSSNTIAAFRGNVNNYLQINLQNTNGGGRASSDFVATANDGTDSTFYVDMGINSSAYNVSPENWGGPHDAYFYSNSRNLLLGTQADSSDVIFLLGGGQKKNNTVLQLKGPSGAVVVGRGEGTDSTKGSIVRGPNANINGGDIAGGDLIISGGRSTGNVKGANLTLKGGAGGLNGADGGSVIIDGGNGLTGKDGPVLINVSSSTGNIKIGGDSNNVIFPKFSTAGGFIYTARPSGEIRSTTTEMTWDSIHNRLGIGIATPGYKLSVLGIDPLYLSGVQPTAAFTTDSVLTIFNGVVKKAPYSSLPGGGTWTTTGNSGTTYLSNFIGTIDNVSMRFRTNNVQRMIIDSTGKVGIGISRPPNALSVLATDPLYLSGVQATTTFTTDSILTIKAGIVKKAPYSSLPSGGGSGWLITGNSGTTAGTNFIGTADQQSLVFKVNNVQAGFLGPSASSYATSFGVGSNAVFASTALGSGAQATGSNSSLAVGYQALAQNQNSIAIGTNDTASADEGIAIGLRARTNAFRGIAIGSAAKVSGSTQNIAIGYNANANSFNGIAIGSGAIASTSNNTMAFGVSAISTGFISLAIGNGASATGQNATAFGSNSQASSLGANAFGNSAVSSGINSLSVGNSSIASGVNSLTLGDGATAIDLNAIAIGNSADATKQNATAFGFNAQASGIGATVLGNNSSASGANTIIFGDNSSSTGDSTILIGNNLISSASNTLILGGAVKKIGIGTVAPAYKLSVVPQAGNDPLYVNGIQTLTTPVTADSILAIRGGVVKQVRISDLPVSGGGSGWALTGNSGTAASNFLGTIDNVNLRFRTFNTERMVIDNTGKVGIGITVPPNALSVLATNPLYLSGVQATSTFTTDSILTILNGVVKKAPYSSLPSGGGSGWSLTGNSGTNPPTQFLGTTDDKALTFKVNNTIAGIIGTTNSSTAVTGLGFNVSVSGQNSVAIGQNSSTLNQNAIAVGSVAKAQSQNSIAIGASANASGGDGNIAIGTGSSATQQNGVALGSGAVAAGQNAIALGYNAKANNLDATIIGVSSTSSGDNSIVMGNASNISAAGSMIVGRNSTITSTATGSFIFGNNTTLSGSNSGVLGNNLTVAQNDAIILGNPAATNLKIGISTITPTAKLDVAGDFKLGASGTVTKNSLSFSRPVNVQVPLGLGNSIDVTFSIPGRLSSTQATVAVSPDNDLPLGIFIAFARVLNVNQVTVRLMNSGSLTIPVSGNFYFTITEF